METSSMSHPCVSDSVTYIYICLSIRGRCRHLSISIISFLQLPRQAPVLKNQGVSEKKSQTSISLFEKKFDPVF